jgi:hypothetical protein
MRRRPFAFGGNMKNRVIVSSVALAAAFGLAFQMQGRPPDKEVVGTYVTGAGDKIGLLGVCIVAPDKIDCWDRDGARSPSLTHRVEGYCERDQLEVPFKFGKKNRLVVFDGVPPQVYSFEQADGSYLNTFRLQYGADDGVRAAYLADPPDDKVGGVVMGVPLKTPDIEIPLKLGAQASVDGQTIEVAAIRAGAPRSQSSRYNRAIDSMPVRGKRWTIILTRSSDRAAGFGGSYTPLDRNREPIRYVDMSGQPLSAVDYLALGGSSNDPDFSAGQANSQTSERLPCAWAHVTTQNGLPEAIQLVSNVDPAKIDFLRFSYQKQERVLFKDIPLDPKE